MSATSGGRFARFQYWQGQTVRARDLRDQLAYADGLRTSHNRFVHGGFGVSFGLAVSSEEERQEERQHVEVDCGLAYDCMGRELVLQQARSIDVPSRHMGPALYLVLERLPNPGGRAPVEAATELRWISVARYRPKCGVPLARVVWNDNEGGYVVESSLSAFRPFKVRPLARPSMAAGTLESTRISWELLPNAAGLQVRVDTSTAGFLSDNVLYFASLLWQKPNRRFAPPFTSVMRPSARGFTLRLLLPRVEAFEIVKGAGLVEETDYTGRQVTFGHIVQFEEAERFIPNDVVARLSPCSDRAWALESVEDGKFTLKDDVAAAFKEDDLVVAANLPRSVTVLGSQDAFPVKVETVKELEDIEPGSIVVRQGGDGPGSAARVAARLGTTLWLASELVGLKPDDRLAVLGEPPHVIKSVGDGDHPLLTFEDDFLPPKSALAVRTADEHGNRTDVAQEIPKLGHSTSKKAKAFKLDHARGLKPGETLAFAEFDSRAFTVAAVEPSQTVTYQVDDPKLLAKDDLVWAAGEASNHAVVLAVDPDGESVTLDRALDVTPPGVLEVADLTVRSTVTQAIPLQDNQLLVTVGNRSLFRLGDVVVLLGRSTVDASIVQPSILFPPWLVLSPTIPGAAPGDVLAVARFARRATVHNVVSGPHAQVVVDNPGVFSVGDTVARAEANGITQLSVVDAIQGSSLVLRSPIEGLAQGQQLAVVALRNASVITKVDDGTLSVDPRENFRTGDLVGRFTHWNDATSPARLRTDGLDGDKWALSLWLDGLLPRDAVGFAALSAHQNQLRFAKSAVLTKHQIIRLAGPHATTGARTSGAACVTEFDDEQTATFLFLGGTSDFKVRPEQLEATDFLATRVPERFAAYALEQGVRIAWFGCQLPAPPLEISCPLHAPDPCACCATDSAPSSPSRSGYYE